MQHNPHDALLKAFGIGMFFTIFVLCRWLWNKLTDAEMKSSASFWIAWFRRKK